MEDSSSTKHIPAQIHEDASLDGAIMATAEDALVARQAAIDAGYYHDPFTAAMGSPMPATQTKGSSKATATASVGGAPGHRRRMVQPIIKRGTHARVCCMDRAIATFLKLASSVPAGGSEAESPTETGESRCTTVQVVLLGSGKDTTFFRYEAGIMIGQEQPTDDDEGQVEVRWYEVDHDAVLRAKTSAIEQHRSVFDADVETSENGFTIRLSSSLSTSMSPVCHLIRHDLRLDPGALFEKLVARGAGFDVSAPTLFVMECVQMYLPEEPECQSLLTAVVERCPNSCLVSYEPILGSDPFGNVMETHLCKAGVSKENYCLVRTRTLQGQLRKLSSAGFARSVGCDMWSAYETIVTPDQRQRANRCEFLDELEEWVLIMRHYCFVVACTSGSGAVGESFCRQSSSSSSSSRKTRVGFVKGKSESILAGTH